MNLGLEELFEDFNASPRTRQWCAALEDMVERSLDSKTNGNLQRWQEALVGLPQYEIGEVSLKGDAICCQGTIVDSGMLKEKLMALKPWRKGPFQLFDIFVDTEWRSNMKWERLRQQVEFEGKDILDVGCGNGYYGWRMLGEGARRVVGLDPYLLYVVQFAMLRRFFGEQLRNYVLPVGDTILPNNLRLFDVVFSMGVLYHRKSPIDHIQYLAHALKQGGELVLETLIIEGGGQELLLPQDRYAQMKNVWFLPTTQLLQRMIERCGFVDVRVLDITPTTADEQRATEWMTFDSLPNFLDPQDPSLTVEGYPAPLRAILKARKS